jgi:hypothetical protein
MKTQDFSHACPLSTGDLAFYVTDRTHRGLAATANKANALLIGKG